MISIIDDDESIRIATESLVRSLGFVACVFESAQDFLQSPQLDNTACLITDVQMPGLNGLDLQDMLLAGGHRMPIIFMTAFPEDRLRQRALSAGAVGFLAKPFDAEGMIECLDRALKA
jgi:FixJ family two-component response regulator